MRGAVSLALRLGIPALIVSLTLHEAMHAWVAMLFGDLNDPQSAIAKRLRELPAVIDLQDKNNTEVNRRTAKTLNTLTKRIFEDETRVFKDSRAIWARVVLKVIPQNSARASACQCGAPRPTKAGTNPGPSGAEVAARSVSACTSGRVGPSEAPRSWMPSGVQAP